MQLTPAQRTVLIEFTRRAEAGLPPPTFRQLCEQFGWSSSAAARNHIAALVKKGALKKDDGAARGAYLPNPMVRRLPLVRGVGTVIDAMGAQMDLPVPSYLSPDGDGFMLNVNDADMEALHLLDCDLVIARKARKAVLGDLAVVHVGGRLVVRRIESDGGAGLVAVAYPKGRKRLPVSLKHAKVVGIVMFSMRYYEKPAATGQETVP